MSRVCRAFGGNGGLRGSALRGVRGENNCIYIYMLYIMCVYIYIYIYIYIYHRSCR